MFWGSKDFFKLFHFHLDVICFFFFFFQLNFSRCGVFMFILLSFRALFPSLQVYMCKYFKVRLKNYCYRLFSAIYILVLNVLFMCCYLTCSLSRFKKNMYGATTWLNNFSMIIITLIILIPDSNSNSNIWFGFGGVVMSGEKKMNTEEKIWTVEKCVNKEPMIKRNRWKTQVYSHFGSKLFWTSHISLMGVNLSG